jgi:hypothetical protein
MRALIALATLVLLSGQAAAEMVDHIKTEYEPLVNTEAGRIDSCGIIFASAVRTLAGRLLIVKGSVSSTFWKENPTRRFGQADRLGLQRPSRSGSAEGLLRFNASKRPGHQADAPS